MPVQLPRQFDEQFERLFNAGDVDGLLDLYEIGATLLPEPGKPATGRDAVREALGAFLALKGQVSMHTEGVVEAADLAVLYSTWSLTGGTDPDGNPVEVGGRATVLLRRQPDGAWLGVVDDPYSQG
jgi:ketosteroid isomerase-like protein